MDYGFTSCALALKPSSVFNGWLKTARICSCVLEVREDQVFALVTALLRYIITFQRGGERLAIYGR